MGSYKHLLHVLPFQILLVSGQCDKDFSQTFFVELRMNSTYKGESWRDYICVNWNGAI